VDGFGIPASEKPAQKQTLIGPVRMSVPVPETDMPSAPLTISWAYELRGRD
jgi:hypothetical protein